MTGTETLDPIRITSDRMSNFDENLLAFYVFLADLIECRTAVEAIDLKATLQQIWFTQLFVLVHKYSRNIEKSRFRGQKFGERDFLAKSRCPCI